MCVSIAFRRSARWLQWQNSVLLPVLGHVSIAFRRSARWLQPLVHIYRHQWQLVSIAFRRSARWLHQSWLLLRFAHLASPLPFGVLPAGYIFIMQHNPTAEQMSPLPFGVLPAGYHVTEGNMNWQEYPSPLPFGVLPAGYVGGGCFMKRGKFKVSIAFRRSARWLLPNRSYLSAFPTRSPLPFGVLPAGYENRWFWISAVAMVSIAFRRSARWLRQRRLSHRGRQPSLHCLSAFCPLATCITA